MVREHHFAKSLGVGVIVEKTIKDCLEDFPFTVKVVDVRKDEEFQRKDIDYIWYREDNGEDIEGRIGIEIGDRYSKIDGRDCFWVTIEVKGDTQHDTGNCFFETASNVQRGTKGCFLITKADFIFYYFIDINKLYVIPMVEAKKWFKENIDKFGEARVFNIAGSGRYESRGRKVPRRDLEREVKGVKVIDIQK